jgi:CubicO group peptidase (beta-lactamase class C family)
MQSAGTSARPARMRLRRAIVAIAVSFAAILPMAASKEPGQPGLGTEAAAAARPPATAARAAPLPHSDEEIARFFDSYMTGKIAELEIPGAAVVVVREGRQILAKGYGKADIASGRPVDVERSLFRAASISKLLPWLLAMELVEEGRLDLDRDLNHYLDFRIPDAFGRPITMRHLMTHTAGFPEHFHGLFDRDQSVPLGERLRNNIPERVYAPGTTLSYSNYGAALAGYVVERLRGRPWEHVVEERIFRTAGMRDATVAQPVPQSMQHNLVSTYHHGSDKPEEFRTSLAPMGSLTASAADMGRLLSLVANRGEGANSRLLRTSTMEAMLRLHKPLGPGLPDGAGLGFLVGEYRGVRHAGHGGNKTTLATDLTLLPDHGLGWYYVFNSQGPGEEARGIRADLLRTVIDRYVAPDAPAPAPAGPSSAKDVAGSYVSSRRIHSGPLMFSGLMNTTEAVAEPDGSLTIESSGKLTRWLPAGKDRFVEEVSGIPLAASRNPEGRVERIASAALYPVAVFERAPLLSAIVPVAAAAAFGTMSVALLAKPFAWIVRRRRRRRAAAAGQEAGIVADPRAARLKSLARVSFWMLVLTLLAWGLFGALTAIDFAFLLSRPAWLRVALGLLTLLSAPFAAILLADAVLAWRDPERGWAARLGSSVLAAGATALAFLFYALEVIDFSTRW